MRQGKWLVVQVCDGQVYLAARISVHLGGLSRDSWTGRASFTQQSSEFTLINIVEMSRSR